MDKKLLLSILKKAKKYTISPKNRTTLEILKAFHITVNSGKMKIEATNLEQYFVCEIPTECEDMNVFPYAKMLVDVINVMDNGEISIKYSPTWTSREYYKEHVGSHMETVKSRIEGEKDWEMKVDDYKTGLADTIHDVPCIVISQDRTTFWLMAFGEKRCYGHSGQFEEENYPVPSQKDLKDATLYKKEEINIGKTGVVAYLYSLVDNNDGDWGYNAMEKSKSKDINKLFPKYLKIDGLVYQKGKLQYDYMFDNGNHTYKYYCSYSNSDSEIRVFTDEIENYEKVN